MLAVLGFVTILLVLALIMSKKVSTLVALIFVPAITGFIAAFINAPNVIIQAAQAAAEKAGTAYVEPVITFGTRFTKALSILSADYMGKGLSSIVATGVMFIFAILFFSTCSDAGVFDPIINRILKFTGEDPVKVCIGTFLIGCICHLDGSGATTFLIAIPACMPLFQKLKMNLWVEATIVALAAGIMNVMPWGGPTVRAAAAMSGLGYEVTGSELWVGIMPAWIAGLATCLLIAAFLGKKEAKRIAAGIPAQEVTGLTEAKTTNTSNELARSGWRWYFNVALILVILYILVTNRLSPAVTFMIGYCVLLIVNYPSVDLQHKIINSHAQAAFLMVSIHGLFFGLFGAAFCQVKVYRRADQWMLLAISEAIAVQQVGLLPLGQSFQTIVQFPARFLFLHNGLRLHGVGVGYGFDAPQLLFSRQNIVQRNALVADAVLVFRHHPLLKSGKGIPHHVHHGVADGRSRIGQELHAARCIELRHSFP